MDCGCFLVYSDYWCLLRAWIYRLQSLDAVNFSRNFGNVGSVQMVGLAGLGLLGFTVAVICSNFLMIKGPPEKIKVILKDKWIKSFVLLGALILIMMSSFHSQYWKLSPILIYLNIDFALSIELTKQTNPEFFMFMNIGALLGIGYAVSSGDGFYQLPYGVSLLIPFMLFRLPSLKTKQTAMKMKQHHQVDG